MGFRHSQQYAPGFLYVMGAFVLTGLAGCGTTRFTDTSRTATEQLLVSAAVDDVVTRMDFQVLAGKKVYLDPQYLEGSTDKGYIISSIRQQMLAQGCLLVEKKDEANYVVEARCGGVGTDRHDLLFGIPQMNLPAIPPWQPVSAIPEIPFAKRTEQKGLAKLAVFAYNRKTGAAVYQSGIIQSDSDSKDFWVLGAGPFRSGSIRKTLQFASGPLEIPFVPREENTQEVQVSPGISVAQPAVWQESPTSPIAQIRWVEEEKGKGKK